MKKIIFVMLSLLLAVATMSGAFGQEECVDCCTGGDCDLEPANSQTLDIDTCDVWVNDYEVYADIANNEVFERSEELEVKVRFQSNQDASDVQIMAVLTGYHRSHKVGQVIDMTPTFDVEAGDRVHKVLNVEIPDDFDFDTGDLLKLRIIISDKFAKTFVKEYNLRVEPLRDSVMIQDVVLDPSSAVEGGRGLFVNVRIKNMGTGDEDSVRITAKIPELGLKATEYVDELESEDATTSEDMFLRIPSCTEPGLYDLYVEVEYADGDETVTEQTTVEVLEDPLCEADKGTDSEDRTVVTVPGRQDVVIGTSGSVYPIIIENRGATDRTYQLSVSGLDSWATYRFDPSTLVLMKAGEMKTVYLYVTPKEDATPGEKIFMVSVDTAGDSKQIALTANVVEGSTQKPDGDWDSIRQGLEIGLVVLVVLLVILGLVVGFSKLKGDGNGKEEMSGQTYY